MLEGISPDQLQMTDIPRLIWIPVREAVKLRWQRNPKSHDLGTLSESFRKHGFKQIPHYDSNIGIDDGNGRVECLDWMERQGQPIIRGIATMPDGTWVMPLIVGVDDKSKALAEAYAIDANNLVLSGAEFAPWEIAKLWDEEGYLAILQELAGGDALPVSVDGEALNSLLQYPGEPDSGNGDNNYSRKIEAPIYTPKGEKPTIIQLYDDSKTKSLIADIDASDLPEDEKTFLRIAAQRHTVLNFKLLADYYAHSEHPTQKLMEDSALVIIDFNRAIELGYVKLSEQIAEQYKEDYPDA